MNNGKLTLSSQFVRTISKASACTMYNGQMEVKSLVMQLIKIAFRLIDYTNTKIESSVKQDSFLRYLMLQKLCSETIVI